ncbi:MAG: hypothetical protein IPO92_16500 [Saprospiraceae bacterium]|nr:hypothetical protein [Saprospiraceae bacterium]
MEINGDYSVLFDANQTYDLAPLFDENLIKGIDVADLLILRKHMQGVTLFNAPLTHYAADMNDDKLIDVADLLTMRKIMQGITTVLPNERKAWKFVPNSFTFPNTVNPISAGVPSSIIYNPLISSQINQDYTGVKRGDLNHSAIPFNSTVITTRSNTDVEFVLGDVTDISGSTVMIDMRPISLSEVV